MVEVETKNLHEQVCIEQRGQDVVVRIPEHLGGGQITEEDYIISPAQAHVILDMLNVNQEDMKATLSSLEHPPEGSDQPPMNSLEKLWQKKDALRIVRPVFSVIQSNIDMGRTVTFSQEYALLTFQRAEKSIDAKIHKYETDPESIDELAYEIESANRRVASQAELRRRKEAGILYDDGSADNPAIQRRKQHRRDQVLDGHIFTHAYRNSRMGGMTLELLAGESIDEDSRDEIAAVACIDARLAAREVMTPEEFEDLKSRANVPLSHSSYWAAATERQMQSKTARARLTTGDGMTTISRSKPGV